MSTGLKVWLWIVFVVNIIGTVVGLVGNILGGVWGWVSIVLGVVGIVAVGMMLFKQKKTGFTMLIGVEVLSIVVSLFAGGIVSTIIGAALFLGITWLFLKNDWASFT
ncbi:MAG: hypothetical protein IJ036_03445 [Lachnospiraceae bacterium]|nr:hypothetical protein [Lachnospiraceae bacterium]